MKMRKCPAFNFHLSILILLVSVFTGFSLFAEDLSSDDKNELSHIRDFTFEITRSYITGIQTLPEGANLASISKMAASLMARRKIILPWEDPVYLCEFYYPEKIGIIASTFTHEDLHAKVVEEEAGIPDFDWVDIILQSLGSDYKTETETVRDINDASKLIELLENSDGRGIEAADEKKGQEDIPVEYVFPKNDGSLRRFSYDGEEFTVWKEGNITVLVNFYGTSIIRKKFDDLSRLIRSERLKTAPLAKNVSFESIISYQYKDDGSLPIKSIEENLESKKRIVSNYNEHGYPVSLLESHYEEREIKFKENVPEGQTEKKTERLFLDDKKTDWKYDEKGRIIEESNIFWNYKKMLSGRYSVSKRTIKNEYDYTSVSEENNLPPDLKFYEDGVLHLERKYSGVATYSEKLFFDGDFSVQVLYENGLKKTEIIYLKNVEQRRRNFEY